MINRVILVGRLTKKPELAYSQTNIPYVRFTLAVNRAFANQNGEREADFVSCIVWRKAAENLAQFMDKGSLIGLEGRIMTGSFERDGKRIFTTDILADNIQYLESRRASSSNQPNDNTMNQPNYGHFQSSFGAQHSTHNESNATYNNPSDFGNNQPYNYPKDTQSSFNTQSSGGQWDPATRKQIEDELPF